MESAPTLCRYCFEALGTQWEIDTDHPLPPSLRRRITAHIEAFDQAYSRFRPDSLVAQVAAAPLGGSFDFPAGSPALFRLYDQLHALTGVIRHVAVQTHATDPTSLDYQRNFAAAVPAVVEGKPLKDVKVGKLAGASGCPIGFNDALDQIRKQAAK